MMRLPKWFLVVLAVALLLSLATPALAAELKGKVKQVKADANEIVVTDKDGKDMTFSIDDKAKVRLNDKDSRLKELKDGDEVTVVYDKKGDKMIATEIRADRK